MLVCEHCKVAGLPCKVRLALPLQRAGVVLLEAVCPGIRGAPGVLIEESHCLVSRFYAVLPFALFSTERIRQRVYSLSDRGQHLSRTIETKLARCRANAVRPPVGPVALESFDTIAEITLRNFEELAIGCKPDMRVLPLGVPFPHDLGQDQAGRCVVGEFPVDAKVQDVVRIGWPRQAGAGRRAGPAERLRADVRIGLFGQCGEIRGEQLDRRLISLPETDEVALHISHAMGRIGVPGQEALTAGRTPAKRSSQSLAIEQVRNGAPRVVVSDRQVADTSFGEEVKQTNRGSGYIGLHRGVDRNLVLISQPLRNGKLAGKLIDRVDLGVHVE